MSEKLKALKQQSAALKAEIVKESRYVFKEVSREIFTAFPVVQSFSWTQYTPYFNDGDACTFSVNMDDPKINGEDSYDMAKLPPDQQVPEAAYKKVIALLSGIEESAMQDMFGDHVEVTVPRTGKPQTDDYRHD